MSRNRPPKPPEPPPEGYSKVIGYARVSTADQDPQLQIDALVRAGVPLGNIYQEKASSGSRRRQYEAMMKDLRTGDTLVVWKLDRLGRKTREVLDTFQTLADKGIAVRVVTQPGMDTSTAMGRLIITVMAAVAEMERDLIRERTQAGLQAARERGRVGGAPPKLTLEQVKAARKQIDQGISGKEVAARLKVSRTALYKAFDRMGVEGKRT